MRFHSGGGAGARYLLPGERVRTGHREIAQHGRRGRHRQPGPRQGREAAAEASMVQVATFDSRSFSEYLNGHGGTALPRALATGRGETAQLQRKLRRGN